MVFDLGLGQRGALDDAPHDRLGAAVELAGQGELQQFASDARLGVEVHRRVGIVEIADDAETLELLGLDADPAGGELTAFLAELVDLDLVLVLAGGAITWKATDNVTASLFTEYSRLMGPAADSTIVKERGSRDQLTVGVSTSYRFDFNL